MIREATQTEREAALFILGYHSACKVRGIPKTFPRRVFHSAVEVALHIIWKRKRIGQMDEPDVKTMVTTAKTLGLEGYQPEPPKQA